MLPCREYSQLNKLLCIVSPNLISKQLRGFQICRQIWNEQTETWKGFWHFLPDDVVLFPALILKRDYECNVMVYTQFMLSWHEIRFDLETPSYVSICSFLGFRSEVKAKEDINFNFIFFVLKKNWICNFSNGFSHHFYISTLFSLGIWT